MQREIDETAQELDLSTGYIYGLQHLAEMAGRLREGKLHMDDALWNSRFVYRTRRMLERQRRFDRSKKDELQLKLGRLLGGNIQQFGSEFKIALSIYLYNRRY